MGSMWLFMKRRKLPMRMRRVHRNILTLAFLVLVSACLSIIAKNLNLSFVTLVPPSTSTGTSELPERPLPASMEAVERKFYAYVRRTNATFNASIARASRGCSSLVESYGNFSASGQIRQPKYAFATYVSSSQFVASAAVALHSIASTGTNHPRVAIVSPSVARDERDFLAHFARVIEVDLVRHEHHIHNERYRDTFTKLRLWQLIVYDKVLYIDADIVVKRNIDDLFDLPTWAVPMDATSPRYNTGMMLIRPSLETFDDMMQKLKMTGASMLLGELLFLTEYHNNLQQTTAKSQIHLFSRWYQVFQEEFRAHYKSYLTMGEESLTIYDDRVRSIHYTGADKPWNHFPRKFLRYAPYFCADKENTPLFPNEPQFVWFFMYSKMRLSYSYMGTQNSNDDFRVINL